MKRFVRNLSLPLFGAATSLCAPVHAETTTETFVPVAVHTTAVTAVEKVAAPKAPASLAALAEAASAKALAEPPLTLSGISGVGAHKKLRVAIYMGPGAATTRGPIFTALEKDKNLAVEPISPAEIQAGKLANFDVLVQPGGSGGGQGKALGEEGRAQERAFVQKGGAYIGICGGSYLATCDYPWSLNILNAHVLDKAHWARGHGTVEVAPTAAGKAFFQAPPDKMGINYWQGPILAPASDAKLPAYTELARFETEVHREGVPGGVMPGKTAVAAADFGEGRVVCFSPHPEKTPGQEGLLHHAILWATKTVAEAEPAK